MEIKNILKATGFRFNKALGQNFITDTNLLDAIVSDSNITNDDIVVEVGTGAGTLTRALAVKAKRVVSFEVDKNLQPVLDLSLQGLDNVEVVFQDILKMSDSEIEEIVGSRFKVVANLPYYITTPLTMRFLESSLSVESITIMVQKEVADRFVAKPNTADYSAITLGIQIFGDSRITRMVSRKMFVPEPNVDSAVVKIDVNRDKLSGENITYLKRLVRISFAMRRKTLANNLNAGLGIAKSDAGVMIEKIGLNPQIRGEVLSLDDYVRLSRELLQLTNKQ